MISVWSPAAGGEVGLAAAEGRKRPQSIPAHQRLGAGAPQTSAANAWAASWRVSALLVLPDGPRVGLVNLQSKQPYLLRLKEPLAEGIEVVSVDARTEVVVLRRGAQVAELRLASDAASRTGTAPLHPSSPGGDTPAQQGARRPRPPVAELANDQPPSAEAVEQHLQQYQMQLLRQDLPPLPILLSPEAEAQLVKEGVLSPPTENK